LAEVAAQAKGSHPPVRPGEALQHLPASIDAAVVDEHQLIAVGHLREADGKALVQLHEAARAAVHRYDDAEQNLSSPSCA